MIEHFLELITDPAHLAFEVVTTIVLALLAQLVTLPVVIKRIRREHRIIDAEHGHVHADAPAEPGPTFPSWVNSR